MADFDPDAYLAATAPTPTATPDFNPDEYLKATEPKSTSEGSQFVPPSRFPSAYIPPDVEKEVTAKFDAATANQPVVEQQLNRAGAAIADTAVGFIKGLPSMVKFIKPPTLTDVLTGAAETVGQMKTATESPVGSQEWWNAVVPLGVQAGMEVGGLRTAAKLSGQVEPPPVQAEPTLTETLGFKKSTEPALPTAAELTPEVTATNEALSKLEQPTTTEGQPNASEIASAAGTTQPEVRPPVGESAPLRQQGQTPEARQGTEAQPQTQTQEVAPGFSYEYTSGDLGTERLVTVKDNAGNVIGQRDPFHPAGIPVSDKARTARIQQVAKEIVNEKTRPEPEPPVTFSVEHPSDPFGTEATPVSAFIKDNLGGLMSKSTAKKYGKLEGNEAVFEDAGPLAHPTHNKIYASPFTETVNAEGKTVRKYAPDATGEMPDVAAQALYDAGLISDPSVQTMRRAIENESKSARGNVEAQKGQIADIKKQATQAKEFGKAQREGWKKGAPAVPVKDLQVGDTVTIKGEPVKVVDIDPDTFDVTLEDGKKFGVQSVKDNTVIYGEHEAAPTTQTEPVKPKLLPGETQGDLISSTQQEPFALAGEKIEAPTPEKPVQPEVAADHPDLFEQQASDWTEATKPEPLQPEKPGKTPSVKPQGSTKEGGFLGATSGTFKSIAIKVRRALDAATGRRSERLQKSFADAQRAVKEIRKVAPTERRQNAISVWMEAGGDAATLDHWATNAKGKAFKRAAEDAKTLTPEEIAIANKARAAFDVLSKRGHTYDILGAHRDNYVPHVWDVSKKFTGIGSSKLQDRFKFNKARTLDTFFDGDQAGFKPKTMAIGKVLPAYMTEMNKVIADRQFVQDVSDKTASDGRPLVVPRGNAKTVDTTDYVVRNADGSPLPRFKKAVYDTQADAQNALQPGQIIEKRPSSSALVNPRGFAKAEDAQGNPIDTRDYKVVDQPALNDWRWVETDPQGGTTILKSDLAVHPELAKRLNAMTGQSAIRQWYNEPSKGLSVIPRAIVKGLDVGQSVMKREMFGLLAPFHQVQEGTHAIGHTINPFSNIPDLERPTPAQADAMRHGLMLLPEKTPAGSYMEGLGGKGSFVSQAARFLGEKAGDNLVGKSLRSVSDAIDGYQDFLFHKYIPGLKFKTYEHILDRNMARYAGDLKQGHVTESDVKLLSASQTDAAYGHLNYAMLDRNPTIQHALQLGLLAPDFLEARGRFSAQALKTLAGEKAGAEQFRAIAILAATQAASMYTLSKLLGGEWDAQHPFEMTVKGRRYMLRSVPEDLHRLLLQGPDVRREFVSARKNPVLQKAEQLTTGLNYRGEKTSATETMTELLANYIPITARSIPGVRNLTETSRNNPVSPLEQLAGSLGLKISRYSPITKTHQLASEWMEKKGIAKDKGSYPISKYQQLRYALEDGDLDRAKKEWDKLASAKGADKAKLAKGFQQSMNHPFTGSLASDVEFAKSLKESDQMIFDHAKEVRKGILNKFNSIYSGPVGKSKKSDSVYVSP